MQLSDFNYNLPEELIAQTPAEPRDHSRLLQLNASSWDIKENKFYEILDELSSNDVLVLNKTRVINARLHWKICPPPSPLPSKEGGRICEVFLHKQISDNTWDCLVFPWKKLKPGREIIFNFQNNSSPDKGRCPKDGGVLKATIKEISDSGRIVEFNKWGIEFLEIVEKLWEIPLPPYIKEQLENSERYQTVFNEVEWSVAAPTASLHFTEELLEKIKQKWVKIEKVLLHVWLGTFMPVETDNILEHKMHSEYIELEDDVAIRLNKYKSEWKRVIAVWTTAIRVLETMSDESWIIHPWKKDTDIFIYPWYKWRFVDAMITNFHLPKSTLLMLVASFAWKQNTDNAYKYAVDNKFRFFSFWDAMFIKK